MTVTRTILSALAGFTVWLGVAAGQTASGYRDLAAVVSEPIFDAKTKDTAPQVYADGAVMSRKERERQRLNALARLGGAVQDAREAVAVPLGRLYDTYTEIRRLDSRTPDYEGLVKKGLAATPAVVKELDKKPLSSADEQALGDLAFKAGWELGAAIFNAYSLSQERDNYAKHYKASRLGNQEVMAGLMAKGHANGGAALKRGERGVTVAATGLSLAGTYMNDLFEFRNDSGKNLTDCSLLVVLNGTSAAGRADTDRHFHFVGHWPAGESRFVWYPSVSKSGIATNESVDVITGVSVTACCDQFTDTVSEEYAGKWYDDYVKGWAEKELTAAKFTGRWYSDSDNWFDPAGFKVWYSGSLSFTVSKVTVEATGGGRTVGIYSADPDWGSGQSKWICHKNFNPLNPGTVKVSITFPGTSYEHAFTWNR